MVAAAVGGIGEVTIRVDVLQGALDEAFSGVFATILMELLNRKFAEKGIKLSKRQQSKLQSRLTAEDLSDINVRVASWKFWKTEDISIELSESDWAMVEQAVDQFVTGIPEMIESASDDFASSILSRLKRRWPRQSRHERAERREFVQRLDKRWAAAFDLLEMLLTIACELGDTINARIRGVASSSPHLLDVQTRLHARACQVASEVIVLLRNGFADGAMARWRTLHEIAVVSVFIAQHGEPLAERYLLHEAEETRRVARQYQTYAEELGFEPYAAEELEALDRQCHDLEQRFGAAFEAEYGWACEHLNQKRPTVAAIEQAVGIDHLRPFYRMASHNVHANPKGVLFKLGLVTGSDILLTGASNFGFADPGQNTAISLLQITCALAKLDANLDALVIQKIMRTLSREIGETFVAIQRALRSEHIPATTTGGDAGQE